MPALLHLPPGTRFRQPDLGLIGTLVRVNECCAMVRVDQPERLVAIRGKGGATREFFAHRSTLVAWTPSVRVLPLGQTRVVPPRNEGDDTMATTKSQTTRKSSAKSAATKTTPAKATKPTKAKSGSTERKLSALDAAAKLLGEVNAPLTAKEMIETMAARGYWTSPGGKTPEATLYAAIIREIAKKGSDARFRKHDRGRFVASAAPTAKAKPAPTKAPAKKPTAKKPAKKTTTKSKTAPADGTAGPKAVSDLFKI
ncbi:MAG: winged helix-turn-helix domain-containing protein [Planctomycetaceae bacterium]